MQDLCILVFHFFMADCIQYHTKSDNAHLFYHIQEVIYSFAVKPFYNQL